MTTVSTALKMFDQITKPLQQVTNTLNLTISAMDNLNGILVNKDVGKDFFGQLNKYANESVMD